MEITAEVVNHVYKRWKIEIKYGPADHPGKQGAIERTRVWIIRVVGKSRPKRWGKYVGAACWIKRIMLDHALLNHLTLFHLLINRKLQTQLDTLVFQADEGIEDE